MSISGDPPGVQQARQFTEQGVHSLEAGQQHQQNDPNFQAMQGLTGNLLQQPYSFTPEQLDSLQAQLTNTANQTYQNNMNQVLEQQGASGSFRSGATTNMQNQLARGLGSQVNEGMRSLRAQAAFQRPADITNALSAGRQTVNDPLQWFRDIANTYSGQATNPVFQQPSPFASALGAGGQLAGTVFGGPAGGTAGGRAGSALGGISG